MGSSPLAASCTSSPTRPTKCGSPHEVSTTSLRAKPQGSGVEKLSVGCCSVLFLRQVADLHGKACHCEGWA